MKRNSISCFGCNKREVGCHSDCCEYIKYKMDLEDARQKRKKAKERMNEISITYTREWRALKRVTKNGLGGANQRRGN